MKRFDDSAWQGALRVRTPGGWAALLGSLVLALLLALSAAPTRAQSLLPDAARPKVMGAQRIDALEIEWVADRQSVAAGETLWLALRLKHDPHWHTYWQNPGDSGLPTTLSPELPPGAVLGALHWPVPMRLWVGPLANYGYEGEVLLPMRLTLPATWAAGQTSVTLRAKAAWLICREVCIPGEASLSLDLPFRPPAEAMRESGHAQPNRKAPEQVPAPAGSPPAKGIRHSQGVAPAS